jgi:hypothetical protein
MPESKKIAYDPDRVVCDRCGVVAPIERVAQVTVMDETHSTPSPGSRCSKRFRDNELLI